MSTKILFQSQGSRYQPTSPTNKLILCVKKCRPKTDNRHKSRRFLRAWYVETIRDSVFPLWNTVGTSTKNIVLSLWHSNIKTKSSRSLVVDITFSRDAAIKTRSTQLKEPFCQDPKLMISTPTKPASSGLCNDATAQLARKTHIN